jgi:hypothetical protein
MLTHTKISNNTGSPLGKQRSPSVVQLHGATFVSFSPYPPIVRGKIIRTGEKILKDDEKKRKNEKEKIRENK